MSEAAEDLQQEVETSPYHDLINHALNQDFNKANEIFGDMMTVKMSDMLDQEKIKLAGQIYNGEDPDDEADEDDDSQLELDLEREDDDEEDEEGVLQEPNSIQPEAEDE